MDPIYVTGHRNPDTDSIVSAMAYAALQNALGNREYVAARLGHISDERSWCSTASALSPGSHSDDAHAGPRPGLRYAAGAFPRGDDQQSVERLCSPTAASRPSP